MPHTQSVRYGPWSPETQMKVFLEQTYGVIYHNSANTEERITNLVSALRDEMVLDLCDLQHVRCTSLFLERVLNTAVPGQGSGLLALICKHIGERGDPWKPLDVQAAAPTETRLTAESAAQALGEVRWGSIGAGGAKNEPNFPKAVLGVGSMPHWNGLTEDEMAACTNEVKPHFRLGRVRG